MHRHSNPSLILKCLQGLALVLVLLPVRVGAIDEQTLLLETADTSSPRSTLIGFLTVMHQRYTVALDPNGLIQTYLRSHQLFIDPAQARAAITTMDRGRVISGKYLDVSQIPKAIVDKVAWRLSTQLYEILIRVPIPPAESIPDEKAMESKAFKRWTLPGTEIRIGQIMTGPRAGEYLFTEETIEHVRDVFHRIREEPVIGGNLEGMYDLIYDTPSGFMMHLHGWIPPRWLINIPDWLKVHIFYEPLWRWLALGILIMTLGRILGLSYRLARWLPRKNKTQEMLVSLIPLITMIGLIPMTTFIVSNVLRFTPIFDETLGLTLWGIFYILLTVLCWSIANLCAEGLINLERITVDSTDSQLLRIAARLIALSIGIGILIEGANRIGLPSYSIFAGLGVGGLAFALAGQQTLGNLLGSLIIMLEKPFRIGQRIRSGDFEGTVEHIGFRTAKLRTTDGDLLYVPSSEIIRRTIENRTLRDHWRVIKVLQIHFDTPFEAIQQFRNRVEGILEADLDVISGLSHTYFTDISLHGYGITVDYVIGTTLDEVQQIVTDRLLGALAQAAEDLEIRFTLELQPPQINKPTV
jgi:MscS family membrane protein